MKGTLNMTFTFSSLFIQLLSSSEMSLRKVHQLLNDTISYPALSSYKNFNTVPPLDRARAILNVFNYPISDDELLEILAYSKKELKEYNEDDDKLYRKSIRIVPSDIQANLTRQALEQIITSRVLDVDPENGNINKYITELIKKDLYENSYLKEEVK